MDEVTLTFLAALMGFIGGSYGSAVGGGGLLIVPALHFAGLPPITAVATSRLGSLGISVAGLLAFGRAKQIDWALGWRMAILQGGFSMLGAWLLVRSSPAWVEKSIALIILVVLVLLFAFPTAGLVPRDIPKHSPRYRFGFVLVALLGLLTGFFQGGGGTLATYIMLLCFGQTFLQSAGTRKIPFLVSNSLALAIFIQADRVVWWPGLGLMCGCFAGAWVGSQMALKRGNRWVRQLFGVVVAISGLRMLLW